MGRSLAVAPPVRPSNTLGERIRRARVLRRMSQAELGRRIQRARSNMSAYESGSVTIDVPTLQAIARELETTVGALLGETPDPSVGLDGVPRAGITIVAGIDISDLEERERTEIAGVAAFMASQRRAARAANSVHS